MIRNLEGVEKLFFEYLNDWFYKKYSQAVHLSFPGLANRGAPLIMEDIEIREEYLLKKRSDAIFDGVTLLFAILSEIEGICRFGNSSKLQYLWTIVGEYWEATKELYQMRYQELLNNID